jgi:iron complex outermembrane recepter protein
VRGARIRAALLLGAAGLALAAGPARAQGGCPTLSGPADAAWPAPLARPVTFRTRTVALRDAIDRLSAAAGLSISYSSDLVPVTRPVCITAQAASLGDVLSELLRGTGTEPRVVAGQVILMPGASRPARRSLQDTVSVLDAVVVTGSAAGAPRRDLTVAMDVADGRALERQSVASLGEALNASSPGVWVWDPSPSSLLAQYGSVRGASSFGATYPKIYIDGVEAANPLVLSELDPEAVERVETIRGPQGASLYGSDAISGVVNLVTRQGGTADGRADTRFSTRVGGAGSRFSASPQPTHEERVSLRTGSSRVSGGASLLLGGTGEIYPDAGTRRASAAANARWVLPSAILTATARVSGRRAGTGTNPLLPIDSAAAGQPLRQDLTHYTLSAGATVLPGGTWTHLLLAGVDGYALDYLEDAAGPFPVRMDSLARMARGTGMRTTLRASSSRRLTGLGGRFAGTLSVGAEHAVLSQRTSRGDDFGLPDSGPEQPGGPEPPGGPGGPDGPEDRDRPDDAFTRHDTGVLAQVSGAWRQRWFATAGARVEHNGGLDDDLTLLPMLGAAWVRDLGPVELKLRAAYGRGIRPAQTLARAHLRDRGQEAATGLGPETQSGIELGAEVYAGSAFSLSVTRFDQRATGLIQDVPVEVESVPGPGRRDRRVRYELQNVGAIDNRGWELRGTAAAGGLLLTGTGAFVDSRVARLAEGYGGDLRTGDRMLAVPARTASLTAEWDGADWSGVLGIARAWDWVNYDRLALARELAANRVPPGALTGPRLRDYWMAYDGSAGVRAAVSRRIRGGVWVSAVGENLLGGQLGEPDNVTIRAGRTLTLGIRSTF